MVLFDISSEGLCDGAACVSGTGHRGPPPYCPTYGRLECHSFLSLQIESGFGAILSFLSKLSQVLCSGNGRVTPSTWAYFLRRWESYSPHSGIFPHFWGREEAMGPVDKAVTQSLILLRRKLHAHELPPECHLLERDVMTRFNLHPNQIVQTHNPPKITCAVKVVVQHLKPQVLEEPYLRRAALRAMMKFQAQRLPMLHYASRHEMEHQCPHPVPIRVCNRYEVTVTEALKAVDELRVLNSNFGLPYMNGGTSRDANSALRELPLLQTLLMCLSRASLRTCLSAVGHHLFVVPTIARRVLVSRYGISFSFRTTLMWFKFGLIKPTK